MTVTPRELQLDYEDIWLPVSSSSPSKVEKIHSWWIPATNQSDNSHVLLYLHGNGGNIGVNLYQAERFHKLGFSVLLIDYRGYGKSTGPHPNESRVYEDAETALNYLIRDRGIDPDRIFLYGHSLGGAIAIETATRNQNIAGLIVQCSFTSILETANSRKLYSLFPLNFLLYHEFNSIEKVRSLSMPILFIHGQEDDVVPAYMSEELYAATSAPKQLHLIPNAGHNDVASVMGDKNYFDLIDRFLEQVRVRENLK
ncbi:alpha/beta hydrolase [Zarconia navalis]|uniref:alpha/beta hydrolase n=1 Tax=Zarconia navalis TaxID=2992134 RepID=UPI0021F83A26|nr:alpha/beta hydrolase [Zarconia navalis]